ncbi:MAG: AraC family transcriptional regulator [Clostridia bacterium]|nr:AraC family transcriptional regulator [Clostridia bacterium]
MEKQIPLFFALQIPAQFGNVKITYLISENCHTRGEACTSYPHCHDDYELRYLTAGSGVQIINGNRYPLKKGELLVLHPGEYHNQPNDAFSPDIEQYSIRFSVKALGGNKSGEEQLKSYAAITRVLDSLHILDDPERTLLPAFQAMTREIRNRSYGYFYAAQSHCNILMTNLLRLCECAEKDIIPADELRYSGRLKVNIDNFFLYQYQNNVKLADLAAAINISERHASRHIKRLFGINFSAKLLEYRLQQAKFQLVYTDKEISAIATDCGFQSPTYFAYSFRKETGITPSEFRRKNSSLKNNTAVIEPFLPKSHLH